MAGRTTGRSAPTLTPRRRLAGETLESTITPALRVRSLEKGIAEKVTRASSLTACSSAGSTLKDTGHSSARTARPAAAASASLHTRRISCACWLPTRPSRNSATRGVFVAIKTTTFLRLLQFLITLAISRSRRHLRLGLLDTASFRLVRCGSW